ncbi:hypothetical protein N7535_000801 [Penicillium sp. DV-2018c]|nr:hypothetical protein N7535_000801 [Penicillium sp. DV-2018c]
MLCQCRRGCGECACGSQPSSQCSVNVGAVVASAHVDPRFEVRRELQDVQAFQGLLPLQLDSNVPHDEHQFSGLHNECIASSSHPCTPCAMNNDRAVANQVEEHSAPCGPSRRECSLACYSSASSLDSLDSQLPGNTVPTVESQGPACLEDITLSTFHAASGSPHGSVSGTHISTQPSSSTFDQGPITPSRHGDRNLRTKNGARFSLQIVKILRNWISSHNEAPYPSEEEKSRLQDETGLSQTQISNWLVNARRRRKIRAGTVFPQNKHSRAQPIDIPRTTEMNPLERWVESPPESEAASITAINEALHSEAKMSVEPGQRPLSEKGSVESFHEH